MNHLPWETPYDDENHPILLFDARRLGKTPAQCAAQLGITLETLQLWSRDASKPKFVNAYQAGCTYYRAFWENYAYEVLCHDRTCAGASDKLLQAILKTQFKDLWNEKEESKEFDINGVESLTDHDLERELTYRLSKDTD